MSSCWDIDILANYCTKIGSGSTPRGGKESYLDKGISLIRSQNVYNTGFSDDGLAFIDDTQADELRNVEVQSQDVLLNITGESVGRCCQVPDRILPARVNQHVVIIRTDKDSLDPGFLRYYLITPLAQSKLEGLSSSGATRRALTKGMIESLEIPIPTIGEQRTIAAILGSLDDKIELNRRMNASLESMAQAIFKSWFIDFDPVHKNTQSRDHNKPKCRSSIASITTPYANLFADSFEASGQGNIPAGWRIGKLSEVCARITSGGTPSTSNKAYWNGSLPWLSSGETGQRFIIGTEKHISKSAAEESSTKLIRSGATVIAGAGQGKTRGQTSLLFIDTYINQSVIALEPDVVKTTEAFLFFDMQRRYEQFRQLSDAHSSRGSLTTKLLADLAVVIPNPKTAIAFQDSVAPILDMIKNNLRENTQLSSSRDTLLSTLMRHDPTTGVYA